MDLRPAVIALTLAAACVAAPANPADPVAERISVSLTASRFMPDAIKLVEGRSYALELVNTSRDNHTVDAPGFFASARMAPADRQRIGKSGLQLASGERVVLRFVAPAKGRYAFRCPDRSHWPRGMWGQIIVK